MTRALARAASAEMHSGFAAVRRDLSMNLRRRLSSEPAWPEDTRRDLARLFELWGALLARSGGPWLLGSRSIADAMFAPVVTRLRTYRVTPPERAQTYCQRLLSDADFCDWEREALQETWTLSQTDDLYPGA